MSGSEIDPRSENMNAAAYRNTMKDVTSLPRSWGGAMVATTAVPRKSCIKGSLGGRFRASVLKTLYKYLSGLRFTSMWWVTVCVP